MTKRQRQKHQLKGTLSRSLKRLFKDNKLCVLAFDIIDSDVEIQTMLEDSNRMAIDRMGFSDHGQTHSLIVSMNGLKLLNTLRFGLEPTIVQEGTGTFEDAQLIVLLSCYLHDIGMSIHRDRHNDFSIELVVPILNKILEKVYPRNLRKRTHVRGHILHAMYCHDKHVNPETVEGGVVGIADATDMTKGRARIPFELGSVNIHSASAMSIERVKIKKGEEKTVRIEVVMNNASGIFQIQELLERKIRSAAQLVDHIELYVVMTQTEDRILREEFRIL
ncbi:MAG: HD domain-containing protein [Candidatus Thorarchaeota archaeon]|nr:MAG: HD domain-containing protein [Candidatus Thorarchaeota archaeon]